MPYLSPLHFRLTTFLLLLGHWFIWLRIVSQQRINKFLATNLTITLVNLNLNLAIAKYLNLVMSARNLGQDHYRIVACLVQRVVNLRRLKLGKYPVKWMWRIAHVSKWPNLLMGTAPAPIEMDFCHVKIIHKSLQTNKNSD